MIRLKCSPGIFQLKPGRQLLQMFNGSEILDIRCIRVYVNHIATQEMMYYHSNNMSDSIGFWWSPGFFFVYLVDNQSTSYSCGGKSPKPCWPSFSSGLSFSLDSQSPRLQAPIDMHIAPKGNNSVCIDPKIITITTACCFSACLNLCIPQTRWTGLYDHKQQVLFKQKIAQLVFAKLGI